MNSSTVRPSTTLAWVAIVVVSFILIVALFIGGCSGVNAWKRGQARANAHNQVSISHIQIKNAQQQADVVHAQNARTTALAEQRVIEARGLAEAQRIVNNTLTPLYVQHEAIQAQERIAASGKNNTVIYVPAGTNGTPIITQPSKPGQGVGAP